MLSTQAKIAVEVVINVNIFKILKQVYYRLIIQLLNVILH